MRRRPLILLALCCAGVAPIACGPSMGPQAPNRSPLATQWLDRTKVSYRAGDFDDAREAATHALAAAPNDAEARELAARVALVRLDYPEVIRLTEGLDSSAARGLRGRAYWFSGDVEHAADELEAELSDPQVKDSWAREVAGLARRGSGRHPFEMEGGLVAAVEMPQAIDRVPLGAANVVPCELDGERILALVATGSSELLLDSATPEAKPYLEEIKNAGERASGLTRQLLAFSRKQVLEPQVLDPNQTVRSMVKMLRVLIGEDIELVTSLSDQIGRLQADPGQLEQVIMNLAVNARDAMPGGGKLIVETQSRDLDEAYAATHSEVVAGHYVEIAMTDTGTGMSKETLEHIFEPFFTTKEPGKGTGLGLATVYGIVKQSRGHVTVYSEPGVGTTFKIYFPSLDKSVPLQVTRTLAAAPKGEGTILLVEDEAPLRVLAAESLKRLGYTVLQAGNGLEALAVADHHAGNIDVVVTDIVMPRMGGPELVEKLLQKRAGVAVIFMSGYTEMAALENAKIGTDAILLNKPFSTEALARKINDVRQGTVEIRTEIKTEIKAKSKSASTGGSK